MADSFHPNAPIPSPLEPMSEDERLLARRLLSSMFYGYHQGPRPRAGAYVRAHGETGMVVAHHNSGRISVVLDCGRFVYAQAGTPSPAQRPRATLREVLAVHEREAVDFQCALSILCLAMHLRGENGRRYANPLAALWLARALVLLSYVGPETPVLGRWLNHEILREIDRVNAPPLFTEDELEQSARNPLETKPKKEVLEACVQAVARALDLGREQIDLASTDAASMIDTQGLERCQAFDIAHEQNLVILGPSDVAPGFVDVIELDSLKSNSRHISGLDVSDEAIDPGWMWDLVTQSAINHPSGSVVTWLADSLQGPAGVDVDVPERRRVALIAAMARTRFCVISNASSSARRFYKRARELLRTFEPAERSRLTGLLPELAAKDLQSVQSRLVARSFDAMLRDATKAMLDALPVPVAAATPEPAEQVSDVAPETLPAADIEAVPADRQPPASVLGKVQRREKVSFNRPSRALRFSVNERLLFASEWKLSDLADAHEQAVGVALEWLEQRLGMSLPKHWSDGAHEIERAGVSVQIEAAPNLFAFRLDHPDVENPTRWWRLEATVLSGRGGTGGMVGLRMQVRDLVEGLPEPVRSVPGLVREWSSRPGLLVAGARASNATHLKGADDLVRLRRILGNADREALVCVSRAGGVRLPVQGPLAGLVRVIVLPADPADYEERYGALQANQIHLFAPRQARPTTLTTAAADWQEQLRKQALDARHYPHTPTFRDVRDAIHIHRQEQFAARTGASEAVPPEPDAPAGIEVVEAPLSTDTGPSIEDIQRRAHSEVREYEELLEVAETERDQALVDLEAAQAENAALRQALALARLQTSKEANPPAPRRPPLPDHLEHLSGWVSSIAPRVAIADKALRHASKIEHREVGKIYAALQALHDHYWKMKFGVEDERAAAHQSWSRFLMAHRLTFGPVGNAIRTSRYQDEYKATVDGRSYLASLHVSGNASFDPSRCLRIYLEVDDERQRLVVTHLPTHLTNSLT